MPTEDDTPVSPVTDVPPTAKQKTDGTKAMSTCTRASFRSHCNLHYFFQTNLNFEVDVLVNTLNSKLYQASVAVSPKVNAQINEDIADVVKRLPIVNGKLQGVREILPTCMSYNEKKHAHSCEELLDNKSTWISKKIYNRLCRQMTDMKTFFRLVKQQRSTNSTATEMLLLDWKTHTSTEEVA